jgi:hypothetical protein
MLTKGTFDEKRMTLPKSKLFYIVSTALIWATPMSIFFCWLCWRLGNLTIATAFFAIVVSLAGGFAYSRIMYEFVRRKYGPASDDK